MQRTAHQLYLFCNWLEVCIFTISATNFRYHGYETPDGKTGGWTKVLVWWNPWNVSDFYRLWLAIYTQIICFQSIGAGSEVYLMYLITWCSDWNFHQSRFRFAWTVFYIITLSYDADPFEKYSKRICDWRWLVRQLQSVPRSFLPPILFLDLIFSSYFLIEI